MENRETSTETGTPIYGIAGVLRETARVAIDTTKIIVREATPELEEGYRTYEATLKMLERNRLAEITIDEKKKSDKEEDKQELESVREKLADITNPKKEI